MNSEFYFEEAQNGVKLLKNKRLDAFSNVAHAFSTRKGGVSTGECESLNLSWKRRDSMENVQENHRRLAQAMGIDVKNIAFVQLTHSDRVLIINQSNRNNGDWWADIPVGYDAVLTNCPNTALLARTADCNTVLLHDPVKQVIGAVHSGWKGTIAGVVVNALQKMIAHYGCDPAGILAVAGPSICADCFAVHKDCADQFFNVFKKGVYDHILPDGRYGFDMWHIIKDQLLSCGVTSDNISMAQACTCCDAENFFSHRRGKGKSGIMLAVIQLR